ncbi:hypothetical protein [Methylococcus capsulatus]|jgi:hypothetical protein|uniref:Lipoprotein n=1 Tax=Methylococcus capsulatus TaxID=414 RepID=A0AA35UMP4_METCP|nr:hypothetical protein [Methylococcus capsulatus]QXP87592.1 hypothetical protein KW112_00040 [Methylococcus capsulatus]QXP92668.1 hypothetical protein KW113_09735 [Methylococcus capsulatus]UQN12608.1 hypothetical protein M3M30_01760 [Methylococcus capsulatus]CAI8871701.1 conserved exported protein of unknown function [Methylococcus capsulatus]
MMRMILMVATSVLSACAVGERINTAVTGHTTQCIDGVEYVQFASGASVAYSPDGKIKTCRN